MMTTTGKKSLTTPPTNLKEAIDWVLKIKNDNNAIDKLAEALEELLKHDGSEVALKVLEKYRLVSKSVIEKLKPQKSERHFAVPHVILNKLSEGLDPFPSGSQANIRPEDVVKVKEWVSSINENTLTQLITDFAEGLNKFVTPGSGILQNPSNSAYKSASSWISLTPSAKTDCAAILLGVMPVVYIGLTYLYWQCEGTGGWAQEKFDSSGSGQGSLKQYIEALGYTENRNDNNGQNIVSLMNSMFSGELKTAYGSSQTHYFRFLKALQEKALGALPAQTKTDCPLTSLYLISYYYITNFLYTVETSSPATPSFAGYSGVTALAGGAYGFNLGGLGSFMSALLA
ncbi:variant erythrocyte surface antigen-1 family protein [Babesia caballi]|uniref:Variant erythrocyte surface antigen-1 family protein n=1 Tax=Babesia caballi TaxID=5871 RepID=A0AAV4LVW2_BABCB|nr:variant erythrocyte surface antigen-1 family protein [Babesia caballi]